MHKREQETFKSEIKKEAPKLNEVFDDIELEKVESIDALLEFSLNHLKYALSKRKLKTGGALKERAERLFSVKGRGKR